MFCDDDRRRTPVPKGPLSHPGVSFVPPLVKTPAPLYARRSASAVTWRDQIVLFGGVGTRGTESILDVSDELWVFNTGLLEWAQIPRCSPWPSARRCAGLASLGEVLYLFGGSGVRPTSDGQERYTFLNDLWTFYPEDRRWQCLRASDNHWEVPDTGRAGDGVPVPRYTPLFWAAGENLILFGGYTEDRLGKRKLNDLWVYRDGSWRSIPAQGPPGYDEGARWPGVRYGSMSVASGGAIYVCGGFSDDGDHIDLWRFDVEREDWQLVHPDIRSVDVPPPRYCAAAAIDGGKLWLFGGRSRSNPKLNFNDLWYCDLRAGTWHQIHDNRRPHRYDSGAEFPAYHAKSSFAVVGTHWYVWGGEGAHGHVSDLWRFDLANHVWQLVQPARSDDPLFW